MVRSDLLLFLKTLDVFEPGFDTMNDKRKRPIIDETEKKKKETRPKKKKEKKKENEMKKYNKLREKKEKMNK